ncbi:MAG: glycosyltransferase family 39 protein [Vampirovibrio sp.]|nr:glycosyltransferase family 39 protein [Vampirovibrio sp.]
MTRWYESGFSVLLITLIGAVLRWQGMENTVTYEEATTYLSLISNAAAETTTSFGLHGFLVKISTAVFGGEPWAIRLPFLLAGVALIPISFWIARTVFNESVGILAAALAAVSPALMDHAAQASRYGLLPLFLLTGIGCLLKWQQAKRWQWLAGSFLGLVLALYAYLSPTQTFEYPWVLFMEKLPATFALAWTHWQTAIPGFFTLLLFIGFWVGVFRKEARTVGHTILYIATWIFLVVLTHQKPAPEVWLFLWLCYFILAAAGLCFLLDWLVSLLPKKHQHPWLIAVFSGIILITGSIIGVQNSSSQPPSALPSASEWLQEQLLPQDVLFTLETAAKPLEYYWRQGDVSYSRQQVSLLNVFKLTASTRDDVAETTDVSPKAFLLVPRQVAPETAEQVFGALGQALGHPVATALIQPFGSYLLLEVKPAQASSGKENPNG